MKIYQKLLLTLPVLLLLLSCTSSKKLLQERQFDRAIVAAVEKLTKEPSDANEIDVLSKAYAMAIDEDTLRIKFLKQSGEPQVWEEIYTIYCRMKERQALVKTLNNSVKQSINFIVRDYDENIIDAKQKAALYFFTEGKKSLAKNTRFDARDAYGNFLKVKSFIPSYEGINDSIDKAYAKGLSHILYRVKNSGARHIPRRLEEELGTIAFTTNDQSWLQFDNRLNPKMIYDFTVVFTLKKTDVSPELSVSRDTVESKQVEDGTEPVLDDNGAPAQDALGHPVTRTRYKTLHCPVTRFMLGKTATIEGTLDIIENTAGQIKKSRPVSAEERFEFVYAIAHGDKDALSKETRELTTLKLAPLPSNDDLILRAGEKLKRELRHIVRENMRIME